jgi:hypothetical protein
MYQGVRHFDKNPKEPGTLPVFMNATPDLPVLLLHTAVMGLAYLIAGVFGDML